MNFSDDQIGVMLSRLSDPAPPRGFAAGVLARVRAERAQRRAALVALGVTTVAALLCATATRAELAIHLLTIIFRVEYTYDLSQSVSPLLTALRPQAFALFATTLSVLALALHRLLPKEDS